MSTDSNLPPEPPDPEENTADEAALEGAAGGAGRIVELAIEDELKGSYLTYAMSVIVSRALPDVRDGLKPSQRRILVAMNDLGLTPGSSRVKCAKISGDTSGNYHPHGESVIYPTLVRMAQEWNLRHVLIDKQGNFGSIAGLPPAAMRYTEARMSATASLMLEDLKLDTVDFIPTYDEQRLEPSVLPSKFPNLLVNGANGIAVGMATSIPPHNLAEICDALIHVIDQPDISIDELMEIVPGPDFPTGGIVCGTAGIRRGYHTGRSTITVRARARIEEHGKNRHRIVVTEIPYQQARDRVEERIAELVNEGRIAGISAIRNESDLKEPVRLILELKARRRPGSRAQPAVRVLASARQLLADLPGVGRRQAAGDVVADAVGRVPAPPHDGHPPTHAVPAQQGSPAQAYDRGSVAGASGHRRGDPHDPYLGQPARSQATPDADPVSGSLDAACVGGRRLRGVCRGTRPARRLYTLTPVQAEAILHMQLGHLVNLEEEKLSGEHRELLADIREYLRILSDEKNIQQIIRDDLVELKRKHGEPRRTEISGEEIGEVDLEDLIPEETMVVSISSNGYIKRTPLTEYRTQHRGGKGLKGADTDAEDPIQHLFVASTHAYLMFFTNRGKVYWRKVYDLPQAARDRRGRAIVNLLSLAEGEQIADCRAVRDFDQPDHYLMMATSCGIVKKTDLAAYRRPLRAGIIAIKLHEGDELVDVVITKAGDEVVLSTARGMAIRFKESDARPMGRNAAGVKGINLAPGDCVVGMVVADPESCLLTVCANGYGKRTPFGPNLEAGPAEGEPAEGESESDVPEIAEGGEEGEEVSSGRSYRTQRRGGKGLHDIKTTDRNGPVVSITRVSEDDHVMMMTGRGKIQRIPVSDVSIIGRNTQGVRIMSLDDDDRLVAVKRVPQEEGNGQREPVEGENVKEGEGAKQGEGVKEEEK